MTKAGVLFWWVPQRWAENNRINEVVHRELSKLQWFLWCDLSQIATVDLEQIDVLPPTTLVRRRISMARRSMRRFGS